MSSRGSINYEVTKELARILRPLVENSFHHIKNTGDFVQQIKGITLQASECIASYDIFSLFTSMPIDHAINIIRGVLELDQELQLRTTTKVEQIISLLEFCSKTTFSSSKAGSLSNFKEQLSGLPSAPLRPTYIWKILRPRPLTQLNII